MNQPTAKPTDGAQGSANSKTPRTPPDWAQTPEREVQYWRTLAVDQSRILNRCMEAAGMPGDACGYALWDKITHFKCTISELWKWSENQKSVHERELNEAKAERDQARQDLEERCAENDRERTAHLQAYQEACKERDEAIANHIAAQSKLTAAESELAELRLDRKRLRGALQFVADWNLPQVESRGELVPYAVAYGSNGERDYMRHIARAAIDSLTAAESELAELRKDRERLVSDSRLVWRSNKFLREAFIETINGLKEKLNTRYYTLFDKPQQSSAHLSWMLSELERHLDDFPADKTGRWIGYVQGCLACNDLLNVDEERDRTRPLFRKAYAIDAARNQQENRE